MAIVFNNIFMRVLTGSLGRQFFLRKGRGGQTIFSVQPVFAPIRLLPPSCLRIAYGLRDMKTVL